jgi:hypothetical protein
MLSVPPRNQSWPLGQTHVVKNWPLRAFERGLGRNFVPGWNMYA